MTPHGDSQDEVDDAQSTALQNGVNQSMGKFSDNPAKRDQWHDLGRFLPSVPRGDHAAAIERNSCMLEDLLATALEYDARIGAAVEFAARDVHSNSGDAEPEKTPPQDRGPPPRMEGQLSPVIRSQIRAYVAQISSRYHRVGFHSFEHASHVMLSATKIVYLLQEQSPLNGVQSQSDEGERLPVVTGTIHDPWLHFAICLSALLHDVDHKGLPNNELLAEQDPLAVKYGSNRCLKSYAEWNSVEIGLSLLRGSEDYCEFAAAISNPDRFYKAVTDLVLCTDIASQERRELGMQKWERACTGGRWRETRRLSMDTVRTNNTSSSEMSVGMLKLHTPEAARAIAEQIMQAADVSHTMQHFSTFAKWNSHLYHEVLAAYQCGRTPQHQEGAAEIRHPKENWYESQIGFFDHYVIPLAERLDACGTFSDEAKFAPLAVQNKEQWIEEGRECTRLMVAEAEGMELPPPVSVISLAARFTTLPLNNKRGSESDSISVLGEVDTSIRTRDDEMSIPGSVETSSRVSFAGSHSKGALARHANRRGSSLSEYDVDSSVNALVPHVLVQQLVDSLKADVERPPAATPPRGSSNPLRNSLRSSTLRESIASYQSTGSIRRHHGALLFVDISGFTHLSQIFSVEDFKTFINRYFTKIIELVTGFGGEVVKFAGDALYALWATREGHAAVNGDSSHARNVEKCTACAIAINATCNNYKVSKSYNRRASDRLSEYDIAADSSHERGQGEVLYNLQDKNAEYEERDAVLNVYCGVSEGTMAGIDVVANNRAEFFLIGKPLKDVAKAENLAGPGELVVSPSVHTALKKQGSEALPWRLIFTHVESDFQRVSWPNQSSVEDMQLYFREKDALQNLRKHLDAQSLIGELVTNPRYNPDNADGDSIKSDLMHLLETHRHEAARAVVGKFTAELRRVVVLFISIMYEPSLPTDPAEDSAILENFQTIYTIISEAINSRAGQVRQFINDDKGTVFIASFGLRGGVVLHPADTAVDAAKDVQKKMQDVMDVQCSIGITLGKIFCGETGSFARYEYSLLGPSVNLSARLMAKGAWGQINCDEELQSNTGRRHKFTISGSHQLKGYSEPVPFYTPADESSGEKCEEQDDIVTFFMQKEQVLELAGSIQEKRSAATTKSQPRVLLIKGDEGKGKDAFVTAILKQPKLADSSVILTANRCYHDDPFYCFIPVITRILLSFSETRERLIGLKKRQKRSSTLATFLANDAIRSQPFPSGTDMVRDQQLIPYLSLANDFVFKGFPLLKSTTEARRLKDGEKVEKCIEVLCALVEQFLELGGKPGMISISEIDKVDSYSKKLIRRIVKTSANLLFIGGASHANNREPSSLEDGTVASTDSSFAASILGGEHTDVETIDLELFDKDSSFDLFRWSLRREFSDEEFELIDQPDVRNKILELCGGMTHATARLAHTFAAHFQSKKQKEGIIDLLECLRTFMNETPTDLDQITCFRIDQMKAQEQMLLKIASVAGFDQYSFTQNLLETVLLALSRKEFTAVAEEGDGAGIDSGEGGDNQVPLSIGGHEGVPNSVGVAEESKFDYIFQGDAFEQTLESLVHNQFLEEVNVEMSDLSSMDSVMYRFRNGREQSVINGLMLNDQKKRTHFEVAVYYSSSFNRGGDSIGENDSSSLSTDMTFAPTSNWELFHIIGLHFDLAESPVPALLNYYDSSAALASLGVRDKAHGRLLSAYLMLEKVLHDASTLDAKVDENAEKRRKIAGQMVRTIGNEELKDSMKVLTREHLRLAFAGDIFAFKKALVMLTKFGQSVGTIEKEGYIFGSELYLQAILLVLLVLEDDAFSNLTSSLASFLGEDDLTSVTEKRPSIPDDDSSFSSSDSCIEEYFDVDDLTVSFPAFSGLLTFYRDSPIGANQEQETFLANLFVAVTQEANQMIHVIRTKCILSHLYLKHGDICKALDECESIKKLYDHDRHSLELVTTYGMDWALICVMTMASTYLFRGQFAAARHNVDFLKEQMTKLDEFASSTKAMSKGNLASYHLLLHEYEDAAEIANGINATQYGYFFRPIGTLQEELANRELSLNQHKTFDSSDRDIDVLSVLSSTDINHNRSMLNQSAETLSDRGIESVRAALCVTEIRNLDLQPDQSADTIRKQIQYCQAGLMHLAQSLDQKDANNHERRKNYLLCLHQRAHLLCWHQTLAERLQERFGDDQFDDTLGIKGTETRLARKALSECAELSKAHQYPFMLLLTGNSYVKLGLNISEGEGGLVQFALEAIDPKDRQAAKDVLSRANGDEQGNGTIPLNLRPPSPPRGVPSAA